jgi:CDGSH-type Zn-finger protein
MKEPVIAKKGPYVEEEREGKKVAWCSCGKSDGQPYCDGSHITDKVFLPIVVTIEKAGKVAWCGCKHSNNKPYCDGSHNKL